MRKVRKGRAPNRYARWEDARDDLMDRIGAFCSFCEMPLPHMGAVEHVIPRSRGGARLAWSNFLIACVHCNAAKKNRNATRRGYVWPDRHDTHLFFQYPIFFVQASPGVATATKRRIESTIDLAGLDRSPGHPDFSGRDRRWRLRFQATVKAEDALVRYRRRRHSRDAIADLVEMAESTGFFSIWFQTFQGYPEVLNELKARFAGTGF